MPFTENHDLVSPVVPVPQLVSVRQAAKMLRVSTFSLRKMIVDGKIQAISLGPRLTRIDLQSLLQFVEESAAR